MPSHLALAPQAPLSRVRRRRPVAAVRAAAAAHRRRLNRPQCEPLDARQRETRRHADHNDVHARLRAAGHGDRGDAGRRAVAEKNGKAESAGHERHQAQHARILRDKRSL